MVLEAAARPFDWRGKDADWSVSGSLEIGIFPEGATEVDVAAGQRTRLSTIDVPNSSSFGIEGINVSIVAELRKRRITGYVFVHTWVQAA